MYAKRFLFLGFCLTLILLARFVAYNLQQPTYKNGDNISFETTIYSQIKLNDRFQTFTVRTPEGRNIYIVTDNSKDYSYGDQINITGKVDDRVISNNSSFFTMFMPKIKANTRENNLFLAMTLTIRQKFIDFFERILPSNDAALLLGIVFGIKENMSASFMNSLRVSGVLHVIAASGMNVTLTAGFISALLCLFFNRRIALFLSLFVVAFYATLAGLQPSIIRASVMGAIVFSARILGRQSSSAYSLFLAGFLMLFIDPSLISDVGFQLSFTATLGLLVIRPLFTLHSIFERAVFEDLATTISAQLATLPILLINFGSYSIFSIIVNALVLWTVPPLMVLGGIGAILGLLLAPLGTVFLYLCLPLLWFFEKIVSLFSSFGLVFNFTTLSWQIIYGYYLIVLSLTLVLRKRYA